jgi:hypothetical protein
MHVSEGLHRIEVVAEPSLELELRLVLAPLGIRRPMW